MAILSIPRFFVPLPLTSGVALTLPDEVKRHLQVLRLTPGDTLVLFNGTGGEFNATLTALDKKSALVTLDAHVAREVELPYQITLAQGIASNEKMDWLIEKAVELGVSAMVPLLTAKSVVRLNEERAQRRRLHWEALVHSACEQCGRNLPPTIAAPISLNAWLATLPPSTATFDGSRLMPSPRATQNFNALPKRPPSEPIFLLIGPEGGLTEAEESTAAAHSFTPIHLGPRILRTETAGMAMISGLASYWDGWR